MTTHREPNQPLIQLTFRGRILIAAALVGVLLLALAGVALGAALGGPTVDCDKPVSSTVNPDGSFDIALHCIGPAPSATLTPSASPSPTVQPSPSVSPTATTAPPTTPPATTPPPVGLKDCLHQLAACGFPDALSTGHSATTAVLNGNQTIRTSLSNTTINGCVSVVGANVTLRNVFINCNGYGALDNASGTLLMVIDSTMTCNGNPGSGAVGNNNLSLIRVDLSGCENGLVVEGPNVTMVDSYVHDLVTCCEAHTDGVQTDPGIRNLTLRHNTIIMPPGSTAAIGIWNEYDPQVSNVVVDGNLLSGGTYTVYGPRQGATNTVITNNRFGDHEYGFSNSCTAPHVAVWSGNVVDATGAVLVAA